MTEFPGTPPTATDSTTASDVTAASDVPPSPSAIPAEGAIQAEGGIPALGPFPSGYPASVSAWTPPPRRRSVGWIVTVALLGLALVAAGVVLTMVLLRLDEAFRQIERQGERIDEQNEQIQEQNDLIDEKQLFGAAMNDLMSTAKAFDGTVFGDVVPVREYEALTSRAWSHRRDAAALRGNRNEARAAADELAGVLAAANAQAATNASGTSHESVLDRLGSGFVTTVFDDADGLCGDDVLGCVGSDDPYTVHIDAADAAPAYMTDWIDTGVSYHEFAHVLQFTNPEETATAVEAFGGDMETMADCFALTYLDGWGLDHTVWVSDHEYWEVSVGYGHTCDEPQRQAIRDWHSKLGYHYAPISQ